MTSERLNYIQQQYEPRLPLKRTGGLLERCSERWENIPVLQLKTSPGWWGNAVLDAKLGGEFARHEDQPIKADGEYLKTLASYVESDLSILRDEGIAESVLAEVTNPVMDDVSVAISIVVSKPKFSIVPFRGYNKPETVKFWLSTLGGDPLVKNTLGDSTHILSNMGGVSP